MRFEPNKWALSLGVLLLGSVTQAEVPEEYAFVEDVLPGVEISAVRQSPMKGVLEVVVGSELYYISEDGAHILIGDLFETETKTNLTEAAKIEARMAFVNRFGDDTSIVFAAEDPIATVTVFTDIDCGYCRKLHREIADYNDLGISIRYLFFPRSGPGTESWLKAEEVWCADSQQDAMTKAKNSENFTSNKCDASVVAEHYELVEALGLRGTPALLMDNGQLLIGYRSPDELLQIVADQITQGT